jgi:hypothetical protein
MRAEFLDWGKLSAALSAEKERELQVVARLTHNSSYKGFSNLFHWRTTE